MTVYEALVKAQSRECRLIEAYFHDYESVVVYSPNRFIVGSYQREYEDSIDRAYLLGVAIDNLRADVAIMEV